MERKRILVVDDEPDLCDILSINLMTSGYAVDTAYSAEEAIKKDISRFDLILLDVMMGEMSGYDLLSKLKMDESVTFKLFSSCSMILVITGISAPAKAPIMMISRYMTSA